MPPKILAQYAQRATLTTAYFSRARARPPKFKSISSPRLRGLGRACSTERKGRNNYLDHRSLAVVVWPEPEPYDRFRVSSEETGRRKGEQTEPGYCLRIVHFRWGGSTVNPPVKTLGRWWFTANMILTLAYRPCAYARRWGMCHFPWRIAECARSPDVPLVRTRTLVTDLRFV